MTETHAPEPPAEAASTPSARRKYQSPVMADRRQRILGQAQAMLEDLGVEGFTIRELGRRADVAQRTIYNLIGGKEDVIASAIHQHFAGLLAQLPPPPPPEDFEGHLRRIDAISLRTVSLKRYATAMVGVFFSPAVDRRLYDTLRWISEVGGAGWLTQAAAGGILTPLSPIDRERLATLITNTGYANITDWAAGRISDAEMRLRWKINFLLCVQPLIRPAHRSAIGAQLARLRATPAS